jgi:hypothetical protein
MQFMLLFSRQGKLRLQKWYQAYPDKTKKKITRELITTILSRKPKMCSFLEWKDMKVVYKRFVFIINIDIYSFDVKTAVFIGMLASTSAVQLNKMIMSF